MRVFSSDFGGLVPVNQFCDLCYHIGCSIEVIPRCRQKLRSRLNGQVANALSCSILLGPKKFHKGVVTAFEPVVVVELANPTLQGYGMQEPILYLLLLQLKHRSRAPNVMVGTSIDRFLDPPSLAPSLLNFTQAHPHFKLVEGVPWKNGNRIPITEYHVLPELPSLEKTISANICHQMHICHRKLWAIGLIPPTPLPMMQGERQASTFVYARHVAREIYLVQRGIMR